MLSLFQVSAEDELLALFRALLEAKLTNAPNDREVAGSPLVVAMADRVATALISTRPEWERWLVIDPTRREWRSAVLHAVSHRDWWRTASAEARASLARNLLAPFRISQELTETFVTSVSGILAQGRWHSLWRTAHGAGVRVAIKCPNADRPDEIVAISPDGSTVLCRDVAEHVVTDWLVAHGFEFVIEGLDVYESPPVATAEDSVSP